MTQTKAIHWFRQDLRLADNPALTLASNHANVFAIYILDDVNAGENTMGEASRWWLHHSLVSLDSSLNSSLNVYRGDATDIIIELVSRLDIDAVYWNRCYEPWRMQRDSAIKAQLKSMDIAVESCNGSLLWEPWEVNKPDGSAYSVFTPFYRKGCLKTTPPRLPLPEPSAVGFQQDNHALGIDALKLSPKIPWDEQLQPHWHIGESGAQLRFDEFMAEGLDNYKTGRNLPAQPYVSRLSPYLHFGEISPNHLWHTVRSIANNKHIDHFCSELGWREFSYYLLYHHPDLPTQNLQQQFNEFPWVNDTARLTAWQRGLTGIPMVDAGMRELWQTGYMHNRVRMIVASFLVKNLMQHWRQGERWFWDTLVDADLANNSASWQWVAGSGADAASYFRIFNPVTQGQKFDPDGDYIRRYIPELAELPTAFLCNPWQAPALILQEAAVELGVTYPLPIVDLEQSRNIAQAAFDALPSTNP